MIGISAERLAEIKAVSKDPLVLELVSAVENLRHVLSETQGSLHVINASASMIRRWINDPNLHPVERAKEIEVARLKAHERISNALFPPEEELAKRLMK